LHLGYAVAALGCVAENGNAAAVAVVCGIIANKGTYHDVSPSRPIGAADLFAEVAPYTFGVLDGAQDRTLEVPGEVGARGVRARVCGVAGYDVYDAVVFVQGAVSDAASAVDGARFEWVASFAHGAVGQGTAEAACGEVVWNLGRYVVLRSEVEEDGVVCTLQAWRILRGKGG